MIRAAILTSAVCLSPSSAQDEPPKLEPVFSDDFSTDTRADYQVTGDVLWEPGRLTLSEGASIGRAINGGPWVKVGLGLDFPELTADEPESELRVWFILKDARNCYVRLRRELMGTQVVSSVALIEIREQDGMPFEYVTREVNADTTDFAQVSVSYRRGLIQVQSSDNVLLWAWIDDNRATVAATRTEYTGAVVKLNGLDVAATPATELTSVEQQQLDAVELRNRELVDLYEQGKYTEAAQVGAQVVEIRKSVLGNQHPDYAMSLNNLGLMYSKMGDYARAEPLYKQALEIQKSMLGELHPDYALSLNNLALLYKDAGDHARAELRYQQVLNIYKSVVGERHQHYAFTLNNLAGLYSEMGRYTRAEQLCKHALETQESVLGKQHPDYTLSLDTLAVVYSEMGDYAHAEPLYKQALEIRKSVLGGQNPHYATNLSNLAGVYSQMGDYNRAERLYKQALEIQRSVLGEQHRDCATTLSNLATLYYRTGDYARIELIYKQALAIQKSVLGEQHPHFALSLNNLAGLYSEMGNYARAEPLFKRALEIQKSVLGKQHPDYAVSLNNFAGFYRSIGDTARSELLYKQALDIRRSVLGEQHPDYGTSVNNLAALYSGMGDYARAEQYYTQALGIAKSVLGESHPHYALSLNNLALVYSEMGDYVGAEPLYKRALEIQKSVLGQQHPYYALSLNNLGLAYSEMGDYSRAGPLYEQALEIRKSVLGEQHPDYALSLSNLAGLCHRMGDYARAAQLSTEAVHIIRQHLDHSSPVQSERQQKRHQATWRHALDRHLTIALDGGAAALERLEVLWRWKGSVTLRQATYRRLAGDPQLARLFGALKTVSRQLSVSAGRAPVPPPKLATSDARQDYAQDRRRWEDRFAALSREREDLERRIAAESVNYRSVQGPLSVTTIRQRLPPGTAFIDFLDYKHASADPEKKGKTNYERRYIAFLVTHEREPKLIGLGAVESLGSAITEFRLPLVRDRRDLNKAQLTAARDAEGRLRQELWLPLEKHLDGIHTVIISPDTMLGTVPWAALPGETEGSYLIEQYRFGSLPMATLLRSLLDEDAPRREAERGLLAVGDVAYGGKSRPAVGRPPSDGRPSWRQSPTRGGKWDQLRAARAELAEVKLTFEKSFRDASVTTLDDAAATEEAFMEQAPRHHNLHLVTHGYFAKPEFEAIGSEGADGGGFDPLQRTRLGRDPTVNQYLPGLLSGIVLAGANDPPPDDNPNADGILTASEIETLDLNAVDLVVLSACDTGLGKTAGGEGLTGLQRAFHVAGARSVVASLWEVDDKATQELMSRFYRYYWEEGRSKIDSLRQAQLDLLEDRSLTRGVGGTTGDPRDHRQLAIDATGKPNKQRTNPRYWAAFLLSGDWR